MREPDEGLNAELGDGPKLKLRALYAELVAFPTDTWQPRPHAEVRNLIEAELEAQGYRIG